MKKSIVVLGLIILLPMMFFLVKVYIQPDKSGNISCQVSERVFVQSKTIGQPIVECFDNKNDIRYEVYLYGVYFPPKGMTYYAQATEGLQKILSSHNVIITPHPISSSDQENQKISGIIYLDRKNINVEIINLGFALANPILESPDEALYQQAQSEAENNQVGMWKNPPHWISRTRAESSSAKIQVERSLARARNTKNQKIEH